MKTQTRSALLVLAIALLPSAALAAEKTETTSTRTIVTTTLRVGERPRWRKIVRGAARVATLGMVQAASDTIKANQPFALAWNHDGLDTDGYNVYINTALSASVPVSRLVNGTASTGYSTGLPKGTYTFEVEAFGPGGTGKSAPFVLSSTAGNPSAPGQIKIIK